MQTTYNDKMGTAFAGMQADTRESQVDSFVNEEASAIPFGIAMAQGTLADQAKLMVDGNSKIVGIAVHTHTYYNQDLTGSDGIPAKGQVNILRRGMVWVNVEDAVALNGNVFVRHTANGGNTQKGAFRSDADTANAVQLAGAVFRSSTSGAGLALVEINLP